MKSVTFVDHKISFTYKKFKCEITADASKIKKSVQYNIAFFAPLSENVIAFVRI